MTVATLAFGERIDGADGPAGQPLKYQLDVVASSVADVVTSSGGWLFDQVMAGWEVNVLVPDFEDVRPLHILGARAFDLESTLAATRKRTRRPQTMAVATDVFGRDDRVSQDVLSALRKGSTEVVFWGTQSPTRVGRVVTAVEYPLTAAAQAFKSRALALVTPSEPIGKTEMFFIGGPALRNGPTSWPTARQVNG